MSLLEPPSTLLQLLRESLPGDESPLTTENVTSFNEDGREEILSYVAFLAAGLAEMNEFDASVWKDVLSPYLEQAGFVHDEDHDVTENFRQVTEKNYTEEDDATSYGDGNDEDAQELCDLRFNLAYGGKILLHQTRLRLLRGHRYALVGQNGVGMFFH